MLLCKPLVLLAVILLSCALSTGLPSPALETIDHVKHPLVRRDLFGSILGSLISTILNFFLPWRGGSLSQQQQNGGGFWGQGNFNVSAFRNDGGTRLSYGFPWVLCLDSVASTADRDLM